MSISQSAMYLGRYTLAIGTVESARHSAELAGEKTFSLLWLTHFCFLLLRKGDWDEALNHLDFLFSCTHPVENPKIFSSTVRGLALYHYLNGRLDAAYRILRRETENAIAAGSPHSPFVDPYILDMLYGFTRAGYPRSPATHSGTRSKHSSAAPTGSCVVRHSASRPCACGTAGRTCGMRRKPSP